MNRSSIWGLLIATGVALGVGVPLSKLAGARGVAPLSFALFPALAAGLLLAGLARLRHGWPADRRRLLTYGLVTGALGSAVPNVLVAWLSGQAGASIAAIAYTLPPVFTLGLALLLRIEQPRAGRLLAIGLGLAGALWLAGSRLAGGHLTVAGAVALLAIPASLGAGNIVRARYLPRDVPVEWLGAAMSLGAVALLLPAWTLGPAAASGVGAAGLPYLFAQVVAGASALVLLFRLQRRADPVTMSFLGYVLALTAVLLGTALLGERLPWQLAPAAALIVGGFWLIQRTPAAPRRARSRAIVRPRSRGTPASSTVRAVAAR